MRSVFSLNNRRIPAFRRVFKVFVKMQQNAEKEETGLVSVDVKAAWVGGGGGVLRIKMHLILITREIICTGTVCVDSLAPGLRLARYNPPSGSIRPTRSMAAAAAPLQMQYRKQCAQ